MYKSLLSETFTTKQIEDFKSFLLGGEWYRGIPGGFVTNTPNRLVNAYGDGSSINSDGNLSSLGWDRTYWTAKMNQNNVSLGTETIPLPQPLATLVPGLRKLLSNYYPEARITDNTFTIAVCNFYTESGMNIAAHRDDNIWYPRELGDSPVFASITLYPKEKPSLKEEYARFGIRREGGKWEDLILDDESVLLMPSDLEHRVMGHTSSKKGFFKPRINITFRSTYHISENPLMNIMAVVNHTRYYRLPKYIVYPNDIPYENLREILGYYNQCLAKYDKPSLIENRFNGNAMVRKEIRSGWIARYKNWLNLHKKDSIKITTNMVLETFELIINWLDE